ncbi:MAG: OB-fold domain-containing protein, partial [Candidatus Binatia bacterium]
GFEKRVPYTTALVELIEDPAVRLATMLDDPPAGGLRVGLPVEVAFERVSDRLTLPRFRVSERNAYFPKR